MGIDNLISLLGGLGLFLFGMDYMGEGLQLAAGSRMKDLLEKLTTNRILGFLVGALVTVVIQSSSATTVMVMGFINAGIMNLAQATGVIFGANIGTTITSILIALDVSGIAPICIGLGAILLLYAAKKQHHYIGQVILGFGLLFQGLHMMSGAMSSLKDYEPFINFIASAKSPLLGFIVGVILCAVIQSSSAAVGVLQALAMQGLMPLHFAAFIVCGINVGSSTPALLSALKAKNNAKRAAMIYLIFNLAGTVLFMPLAMLTPLVPAIEHFVATGAFQISVFHILFKAVTGVVLLPLVGVVVNLTYKIIPKQAHESEFRLVYIDPNFDGAPAVSAIQIDKEIKRMAEMIRTNLAEAGDALVHTKTDSLPRIHDREQVIDYLTAEISNYISRMNTRELPEEISMRLSGAFNVLNDLEQVGDHAYKISRQAERCAEAGFTYSEEAQFELQEICDLDLSLLDCVENQIEDGKITPEDWREIKRLERSISKHVTVAQNNHMKRIQDASCTFERGLSFVEALNSYLRIVNHAINIAETIVDDDTVSALESHH